MYGPRQNVSYGFFEIWTFEGIMLQRYYLARPLSEESASHKVHLPSNATFPELHKTMLQTANASPLKLIMSRRPIEQTLTAS